MAVAASLLAEVTVFSAVKFSEAGVAQSGLSVVLGAVFLTLIVLAGSLLGLSRGRTEWQSDLLTRYLSRSDGGMASHEWATLTPDMSIDDAAKKIDGVSANSPGPGFTLYVLTLIATLMAGTLLVAYVWLPIVKSSPDPKRPVQIVGLPISIYFDVDRALVSPSMQLQVEALARRVSALPNVTLLLEGHADSDYRSDYNLELSRQRAEVVKQLLVTSGFDVNRIKVAGFGETSPRSHEKSLSDKAQNRRVDIFLLQPKADANHPPQPKILNSSQ